MISRLLELHSSRYSSIDKLTNLTVVLIYSKILNTLFNGGSKQNYLFQFPTRRTKPSLSEETRIYLTLFIHTCSAAKRKQIQISHLCREDHKLCIDNLLENRHSYSERIQLICTKLKSIWVLVCMATQL
jgi:hypothetical protein